MFSEKKKQQKIENVKQKRFQNKILKVNNNFYHKYVLYVWYIQLISMYYNYL